MPVEDLPKIEGKIKLQQKTLHRHSTGIRRRKAPPDGRGVRMACSFLKFYFPFEICRVFHGHLQIGRHSDSGLAAPDDRHQPTKYLLTPARYYTNQSRSGAPGREGPLMIVKPGVHLEIARSSLNASNQTGGCFVKQPKAKQPKSL